MIVRPPRMPGALRERGVPVREGRRVSDSEFDALLPPAARAASSLFWTPASVAVRAARLLVEGPDTRVLDIGSGVGKFCVIGAAFTGASFVGLEHREHFVRIAAQAANDVEVGGARFVHGGIDTVSASDYDAFYLYNPFEENLCDAADRLDDTVLLSELRFQADVERAQRLLDAAPAGTRVVTYHGFGGDMPAGYRLALRELHGAGELTLWVKADSATAWPIRRGPRSRRRA